MFHRLRIARPREEVKRHEGYRQYATVTIPAYERGTYPLPVRVGKALRAGSALGTHTPPVPSTQGYASATSADSQDTKRALELAS